MHISLGLLQVKNVNANELGSVISFIKITHSHLMNGNVRVLHTHRILQLHVATTIYEDKHTIIIVMAIYRYMCTLSVSSIKRDKCTYFTHLVTTVAIK